jgi:hypothetical protein
LSIVCVPVDYPDDDKPIDLNELLGDDSQAGSGGPPPIPSPVDGALEPGYYCAGCGYALDGLKATGVCPECGMQVSRSLAGDLLRDASSEYVSRLQRGASLVYWSLIAIVVLTIGGFVGLFAFGAAGGGAGGFNARGLQILLSGVGFLVGLIGFYGWWLLSSPDPRHGPTQQGTARIIVRIAVAFRAAVSLFSLVANIIMQGSGSGGGTPTISGAVFTVSAIASLLSFVAWIVGFIAAMVYLQGLALRIPNRVVYDRARRYIWLLPLIYVLLFLCFGLGILIALVMYVNLIDLVRKDLKKVLVDQTFQYGQPTEPDQ